MGFGTQLRVLLWKNFTLRKRQKFRLFAEIVFPLALFLILVIVRTRPDLKVLHDECHFDGNAMPSAGTWPFVQSIICNADNQCHSTVTADERPGFTAGPQSLFTSILEDIGEILDPALIQNLLQDGQTILRVLGMIQSGTATGGLTLGNIVTNPTDLRNQILNNNVSLSPDVIDAILNASINPALPTRVLLDFGECSVTLNRTNSSAGGGSGGQIPGTNMTAEDLQDLLCQQGYLNQTLIISSDAVREAVQNQICNLTTPQFDQLYALLLSALNDPNARDEIIRYIERNAGQSIVSSPLQFLQLYQDFMRLYAIYQRDQQVITAVENLISQLQGATMGANVNVTQSVQSLVCGRGSTTQCRPGYYISGQSCLPCPIGTYQSNANQGSCIPCEDNLKTNSTASTREKDCQVTCVAGKEGDDDCEPCDPGFYKPTAGLYPCMKCPVQTTSDSTRTKCSIMNCSPGYYISNGVCTPCMKGYYQSQYNQTSCTMCPANHDTTSAGSKLATDCIRICPAGTEGSNCDKCQSGFYKSSSGIDQCVKCPDGYSSSADKTQCILDCAPGTYIDGSTCTPCAHGTYQPKRAQSTCLSCDPSKNTTFSGSVKKDDCKIYCGPGQEGTDSCAPCKDDFYKPTGGKTECLRCTGHMTSTISDRTRCSELYCDRGYFYDSTSNTCKPCPAGQYKSKRGKQTQCSECGNRREIIGNPGVQCKRTVCADLVDSLKSTEFGKVVWRQIKPLVEGKIPYAPNSTAINEVIRMANKTFDDLYSIVDLANTWRAESDSLFQFLDTDPNIQLLRDFTCSEVCDDVWHTVRRAACNGSLPGFNVSDILAGQTVGGFDISSIIPGFASAAINNYLTQAAGLNFSFMCDIDPNYSPCQSLFSLLYSGNDINISNFTWKDALNGVNQVFDTVAEYGQCFVFDKFVGFKTEYELTVESLKLIGQNKYFGAIVFDDEHPNGLKSHVTYSIRMNQDRVDTTNRIQDRYWRPGPRSSAPTDTKYVTYGFAYLQDMIDHAIIKLQTYNTSDVGVITQMFPYPCYIQDKFIYAISRSLPLFLVLAWVLSVAMICKNIVYEKEYRLKEVMKIMGLSNGVHWMAWFIDAFVVMFMSLILLVIIMKAGKVLEYSDPSVVLFMLTAFTIATISQCFLISVFFSKANIAACVAGFLYFMLYLPYPLCTQWEELMTNTHKTIACLSSSVAFGFGCSYIARYEEQAIGIQWSNLGETPIVDDEYSLLYCIIMMLADAVIYGLVTWYIEAVFPGQYGIPRPFYFMFTKSYWCDRSSSHSREDQYLYEGSTVELRGQNAKMEEEPKNKRVGVSIRNLKKVYTTGKKVAVDGLSVNFYEGQISSFLGHNGAGKTTTMSILTGLFPPTDGTAFIYGHNILTDMDAVRNSLGMCPQHNVLFDKLTVEEHLWFYARLKNMEPEKVKREMDRMIKDVGLPHKRKELSSSLSGGMKRKLSVAIAFVGNAKTVILDEPTAGIDPYARKEIWELLLKLKKRRTIILSTHHMDEADVLGDRIAIISQGKLCCCGSSLYLKSQYGNGYYLTLVQDDGNGNDKPDSDDDDDLDFPDSRPITPGSTRTTVDVKPVLSKQSDIEDEGFGDNNSDEKSESDESKPPTPPPEGATMIPGFSTKRTTEFICKYIKKAKLVEESTTELTYQLPADAAHSGKFEALFKQLERSHKDLGISSFGISDTSLEEVFLRVADETGVDLDDESKRKKLEEVTDSGRFARPVTRLSFRRKKKRSFLKDLVNKTKKGKPKIDSHELLEDTESVVSVPVSEKSVETGFSHMDHVKLKGNRLKLQQFKALFLKRFHRLRRSKKGFFFEIILPALFVLAAMAFAKIRPPTMGEPPLELHPWMYTPKKGDAHLNTFFSNDGNDFGIGAELTKTLLNKPWMGNRCMNPKIKQVSDYSCKADTYESLWTQGGRFTGNDAVDFPQCDCSSGFQVCPPGAGGPEPPKKLLPTTDYLYNMTGRNISDWLVKTMKQYQKRRYGGFSFGDVNNVSLSLNTTRIREIFENVLSNLTQSSSNSSRFFADLEDVLSDAVTQDTVKVWYNNKGWTAIVSFANVMNNLILRSRLPPGQNPEDYGITTFNYPMNATVEQFNEETLYNSFIDVTIAICVIFAMSFVPASFVMVLIEERSSSSKHLQFVSGVNPFIYWLANFSWDMVNYLIPCFLSVMIFLAFQTKSYVGEGNLEVLIVLLILYGFAMAPLMYPFTRFFSVPSTAMVVLTSVNIFLGTTSTLATFIIEFLEQDDEELANVNYILRRVFLLLPQYCLGRGLMDMSRNQLVADAADVINPGSYSRIWKSPFLFDQVGRNMLSMFSLGLLFFIINLLVEYNFFLKRSWNCFTRKPDFQSLDNEDEDVANERKRITNKNTKDDVLIVDNLTKVYRLHGKKGRNIAVDRSCFGVPNGQCFGLLGVNGAGKTTTFKMLTGDVEVTQGNARLNGHSILSDLEKVRLDLGYCPQFDAFDPLLTGREILCFFARLRGIQEKDIKQISSWCIRKLGLIQYADKMSGDYSGGNKRKLSTAISLIGNPSVIFMDEPTTGMDPHARRFLWNCINNIVKDGRSVILTSHSMEECEALCNRLAIMVNGRLKCIGSTQHLKNKFGDGYTVIIRVAGEVPNLEPIKEFMTNVFGDPDLKEEHNNMIQYQLDAKIKLSRIFGQLEAVKEELMIEDYSVSQTTLDQVFIHFASKQTDMLDDEMKTGKEGNENGIFHRSGSSRNSIAPDDSDMESVTGSAADLMSHERKLNLYGSFRGETTDDESLAGSTVELVRPNSSRSSTRSAVSDSFPNVQIF